VAGQCTPVPRPLRFTDAPMRGWVGVCLLLSLAAGFVSAAAFTPVDLTPKTVAEKLQQRFDQLTDYEAVMNTETRSGARVDAARFHVWFRKPALFRLRVLKGRQRGSELVVEADGSLRGRRGGLLRPFSRRLSRSDPSLRSLRGQPAWELDLGSFLRAMRERMSQAGSSSTVRKPAPDGPSLSLEVRYRSLADGHPLRDVWTIDPRTWLLVGGEVYDGEQRVDRFEITDFMPDRGLPLSMFRF
jgi:outer membrane lipoprotein-sorting protein